MKYKVSLYDEGMEIEEDGEIIEAEDVVEMLNSPQIKIGSMVLKLFINHKGEREHWLEREGGEGMGVNEEDLEKCLQDWFTENF